MDIIYIGVMLIFFALTWALIKLCEALSGDWPNEI